MQFQPMPKQPEAIQAKWVTAPREAELTALQLTFQLLPPAYDRSRELLEGREASLTPLEGE